MIYIIVFVILSLDQLSKILISRCLSLNQSMPVIKGIFYFTLVHNRGAAFGILKDQVPLFIITAVFAIILAYRGLKEQGSRRVSVYTVSLGFILAGGIGNLIDRLFRGYVVDFLDLRIWPVFNLADSAITVGAVLLAWTVLFNDKINLKS